MNVTSFIAPAAGAEVSRAAWRAGTTWLTLPFDALRAQYADAVRAGIIERSLLASGAVERVLASAERFVLGPWARSV